MAEIAGERQAQRAAASGRVGSSVGAALPARLAGSGVAAAALLGITALFVLGHSWVVALIMTGVVYRVAKTDLVKRWSGNAFNLLLVYLVISIASGLVFGAVDLAISSGRYSSEATLGEKVGDWIRYVTAIVFAVSAVAAYRHRYFRYPTLLHPLRS